MGPLKPKLGTKPPFVVAKKQIDEDKSYIEAVKDGTHKSNYDENLQSDIPAQHLMVKIPYAVRAAVVCSIRSNMAYNELHQLTTYLMEQANLTASEKQLIKDAESKVAQFSELMRTKLGL